MATVKTKKHARKKKSRVAVAGKSSIFRQRGIPKARRRAELKHIPWNTAVIDALNPLLGRQVGVGREIIVARGMIKIGGVVLAHSHRHERVTYILAGGLKR